ncbi:hypothetical protein AV530_016245 [Patagioenas fasciata monilis]|uniref:Uncharacterized protein n=1 Tax=Patagioenas fasciata monilis TaxID=372326 RepID=A0A1V4JWK2_PATFA|nr:hypothetical protein AV530_016245 [Patagioenas fasciata monilis]
MCRNCRAFIHIKNKNYFHASLKERCIYSGVPFLTVVNRGYCGNSGQRKHTGMQPQDPTNCRGRRESNLYQGPSINNKKAIIQLEYLASVLDADDKL